MSDLHVVFGTGAAGTWTAVALAQKGLRVRAINRSGRRPEFLPAVAEVVSADVSDPRQAIEAAKGASVVYQALNPAYHQWHALFPGLQANVVTAAKAAGARLVSVENLYMYGRGSSPMNERSIIDPPSRKGVLRAGMAAELQELHRKGELEVAQGRASDYYGPGVQASALGERTFSKLVAGKPAELAGSGDVLHSYSYIKDVGLALATLGTHDEAFGGVWMLPHASARTGKATLLPAFEAAGTTPKYSIASPGMFRFFGFFDKNAREMVEMMYEFTEPFVVDSSKIESTFGLTTTSLEQGMRETVAWYRGRANRED